MLSRMLSLKTDAGSGALEQMVLAEYCAPHFAAHVPKLTRGLRAKLDTLMEALNEQFGTSAEFDDPKGGIFLWVKLPEMSMPSSCTRPRWPLASPSIPGRNGPPTRPMPAAACGYVSPVHRTTRSAKASPFWLTSAEGNSACRRAAPTSRSRRQSMIRKSGNRFSEKIMLKKRCVNADRLQTGSK